MEMWVLVGTLQEIEMNNSCVLLLLSMENSAFYLEVHTFFIVC